MDQREASVVLQHWKALNRTTLVCSSWKKPQGKDDHKSPDITVWQIQRMKIEFVSPTPSWGTEASCTFSLRLPKRGKVFRHMGTWYTIITKRVGKVLTELQMHWKEKVRLREGISIGTEQQPPICVSKWWLECLCHSDPHWDMTSEMSATHTHTDWSIWRSHQCDANKFQQYFTQIYWLLLLSKNIPQSIGAYGPQKW
jgi:hypothetical protein